VPRGTPQHFDSYEQYIPTTQAVPTTGAASGHGPASIGGGGGLQDPNGWACHLPPTQSTTICSGSDGQ
jgi:hypothetical protein